MQLSVILEEFLVPIAEVESESVILIGDSAAIYLSGIVGEGVLFAGYSFSEGNERVAMAQQLPFVEMYPAIDPEGQFTFWEGCSSDSVKNEWPLISIAEIIHGKTSKKS